MKLMTNLFIGKKPSLEEGQMIYQIENDKALVNHVERNKKCRCCIKLMRVLFYVALVLFVFFIICIGLAFLRQNLIGQDSRGICGFSFLSDYDELTRDRIQDGFANDPSGISEEDIVLEIFANEATNKFVETETSTMSDAERDAFLDDINDTMKLLAEAEYSNLRGNKVSHS